jgi:outer membrane protein assembly factor BamA
LSANKYLNKQKTELDKRLLKSFYLDQGYYNVNVEEAFTQLFNKKGRGLYI